MRVFGVRKERGGGADQNPNREKLLRSLCRERRAGWSFFLFVLSLWLSAGAFFPVFAAALPSAGDEASEVGAKMRPPAQKLNDASALPKLTFTGLAPGLELGLAHLPESKARGHDDAVFVVLRVDPGTYSFSLHMAGGAEGALSPAQWSGRQNLCAGINAGMYLPDKSTSIGYMRAGKVLGNPKMGDRLGAFFVAGQRKKGIAAVDVIEREGTDWRGCLQDYNIVVQNYRLMDSNGRTLWAEKGRAHSSAVVTKDARGRILFILSQEPLPVERFISYLKGFSLSPGVVMYVEGSAQACLFVRLDAGEAAGRSFSGAEARPVSGGVVYVWRGRQGLLNLPGNTDAVVPNIIGVTKP